MFRTNYSSSSGALPDILYYTVWYKRYNCASTHCNIMHGTYNGKKMLYFNIAYQVEVGGQMIRTGSGDKTVVNSVT